MIKTVIGGIEVQDWITDYRVENPAIYGNQKFTDINGVEIQEKRGDKVILTISMADVPTPTAVQLATVLQQKSIAVDYTTPAPASNKFKKTKYYAACSDGDPDEPDYNATDDVLWDIDVTLESTDFNSAQIADDGNRL